MGCEDFQVTLKNKKLSKAKAKELILKGNNIIIKKSDDNYFEYNDKNHLIEIQLRELKEGIEVSLRFALCNPLSIDEVFFNVLQLLSVTLSAEIDIIDEYAENEKYARQGLKLYLFKNITIKRGYWIKDFGSETATISCDDALKKFVLGKGM